MRISSDAEILDKEQNGGAKAQLGDRVSQGFELIFGDVLERQKHALERMEAEVGDRLEYLERDANHKNEALAALQDRANASLEREDGELRRRRSVEGELRESFARLVAKIDESFDEIRTRLDEVERSTAQQIADLRSTDSERDRRGLEQLRKAVGRLAATKLDRSDLVNILTSASRELSQADERENQSASN